MIPYLPSVVVRELTSTALRNRDIGNMLRVLVIVRVTPTDSGEHCSLVIRDAI